MYKWEYERDKSHVIFCLHPWIFAVTQNKIQPDSLPCLIWLLLLSPISISYCFPLPYATHLTSLNLLSTHQADTLYMAFSLCSNFSLHINMVYYLIFLISLLRYYTIDRVFLTTQSKNTTYYQLLYLVALFFLIVHIKNYHIYLFLRCLFSSKTKSDELKVFI